MCTSTSPSRASVSKSPPRRDAWPSGSTFVLASIGSAIGFGNIWRMPMMCYTNGGGAFMLPYLIALFVAAIPMVVLEFALGQALQRGHVAMISTLSRQWVGVGWASVLGTFLLAQFYSVLLAYVLVYLFNAFRHPQPWAAGVTLHNVTLGAGVTNVTRGNLTLAADAAASAHREMMYESSRMAAQFWEVSVLNSSGSIADTGGIVGSLALAYALVLAAVCLGVVNGAHSIGLLNKILMPLPLIVMFAFFFRAILLPGAGDGIALLFTPSFGVLADPSIWVAAVSQLLFGTSAALGTLTTYASYTSPNTPVVRAAVVVALANSAFSILAAVTVFGFLGFLSHATGVAIEQLVASGPALAFQVFPIAFGLMPLPQLWAFLFFLMLLNLGLSSAVSMTSPLVLSLCEARDWRTSRIAPSLHLLAFLTGLMYVTRSGNYWLELSDHFVPMFLTLIVGLAQCLLVARYYGASRLMSQLHPADQYFARWWIFCWRFLLPILLAILLVSQIVAEASTPFGGFPSWALAIGWLLSCGPLILVPIFYVRTRCSGAHGRATFPPSRRDRGGGVFSRRTTGGSIELRGVRLAGEEVATAGDGHHKAATELRDVPCDELGMSATVVIEDDWSASLGKSATPTHAKMDVAINDAELGANLRLEQQASDPVKSKVVT